MSSQDEAALAGRLRSMQIIVLALSMGVISFLAIAIGMRATNAMPPRAGDPIITYVGLAVGCMQVVLAQFIPNMIAEQQRKKLGQGTMPEGATDEMTALWGIYAVRMLIGAALLEGACFFLLIAYLVEGQRVAPLMAGTLLVMLIFRMPTRGRVEAWVERQRERLLEERTMGRGE